MTEKKGPPSMRDFDYFAPEKPTGAAAMSARNDLPEELEERLRVLRKRRERYGRAAILALTSFAVLCWFCWGYRDEVAYAFQSPRPPQKVGDVVDITPGDLPHNSYVEVTGITEHRGLVNRVMRGLVPGRKEMWYFRLLGSRGVFIETPPDKERFGFTTELTVSGRVVDPERSEVYHTILRDYVDHFSANKRPEMRVIQVDVKPGDGRGPFYVFFLVLLVLASLNSFTLARYLKLRAASDGITR